MTERVTRKAHVISFMVLAIMFVPVFLDFLMLRMLVPCCGVIFWIFWKLSTGISNSVDVTIDGISCVYLAFYGCVFYFAARMTFWLSEKIQTSRYRFIVQAIFLLTLFSCSFLRVINATSFFEGVSGTYNF
jgi:hypothetical protein